MFASKVGSCVHLSVFLIKHSQRVLRKKTLCARFTPHAPEALIWKETFVDAEFVRTRRRVLRTHYIACVFAALASR